MLTGNSDSVPHAPPAIDSVRQVSILFADIVGSTGLIGLLDAEAARDRIDPALQIIKDAVHASGGAVARIQGDGVMAVFGMLTAVEDHALRAAIAGCSIRDGIRALDTADGGLQVRVGLHSGPILLRWQDNDFGRILDLVGSAANVAGRVEQLCPPGAVAVSEATLALIDEPCVTAPLGALTIGESPALAVSQLESVDISRADLLPVKGKALNRLIGRDEIMARVRRTVRQAGTRQAAALAIVGEAGIGKSRLLAEATLLAGQDDIRFAVVRGNEISRDAPFGCLVPALHLVARDFRTDGSQADPVGLLPADEADCIRALLGQADTASQQFSPDHRNRLVRQGIARILRVAAESRRILLVVDDAQYLDSETRSLLEELGRSRAVPGLAMLLAGRPEARPFLTCFGGAPEELETLDFAQSKEFIERIFAASGVSGSPLAEAIVARAGGLPLAIEEFAALAVSSPPSGERDEIPQRLPARLESVFLHRLGQLGPQTLRSCMLCCALGSSLSFRRLRWISTGPDSELDKSIDALIEARVLQLDLSGRLGFTHQLVQEACYGSFSRRELEEVHRSIWQNLCAEEPGRRPSSAELARHAECAGLLEEALGHLWQACEEAIAVAAIDAVRGLYRRARSIARRMGAQGQLHASRFALLSFDAMQQLAAQDEGREDLLAIAKSQVGLSADTQVMALVHLSMIDWISGRPHSSRDFGARALAGCGENTSLPLRVYAEFTFAHAEFGHGKPGAALQRLQGVCEMLADAHKISTFGAMISIPGIMARSFGSWYATDIGEFAVAREMADFVREHGEQLQHNYSRTLARLAHGYLLYREGRAADAALLLGEAHAVCVAHSFGGLEPMASAWLALAQLRCGQTESAREVLSSCAARGNLERVQNSCRYYAFEANARLYAALGDDMQARQYAEAALAHATAQDDRVHQLYGRALQLELAEADDPVQRRALAADALALGMRPLAATLSGAEG